MGFVLVNVLYYDLGLSKNIFKEIKISQMEYFKNNLWGLFGL